MVKFETPDLLRFAMNECPPEVETSIQAEAARDPALAAKLAMIRESLGVSTPAVSNAVAPRSKIARRFTHFWSMRLAVYTAVFVAIGGGAGWAGYRYFHPPALLYDNFNDEWFDSRLWKPGRPGVRELNGYMRLMNRGSLVTQQEFDDPITVSFRWRWLDHAQDPFHGEELIVALRTTGVHKLKHSFEIEDGILVRIKTWTGALEILEGITPDPLLRLPKGSLKLVADAWYDVRITDDGERISVYMAGPGIDPKYRTTPVAQAECKAYRPGRHVAVYNREVVSGAMHESWIGDFAIRRLDKN